MANYIKLVQKLRLIVSLVSASALNKENCKYSERSVRDTCVNIYKIVHGMVCRRATKLIQQLAASSAVLKSCPCT
jgi:hypothetical protein